MFHPTRGTRSRCLLYTAVAFLLMAALTVAPLPAAAQQLNIATASVGGAFYPIGVGIAEIVSSRVPGVFMTAEVTQGAVENPRLVGTGLADLGITNANTAYFAFHGSEPYQRAYDIRALGLLHSSILHVVTLQSSPIETIRDMRGRRVAVGPPGGGSIPALEALFDVHGVSFDEIQPSYLSYNDGMQALRDRTVDVALALAGFPVSSVLETESSVDVRFVRADESLWDELTAKYPYFQPLRVPDGTYRADTSAPVLAVPNLLVVPASMDEELVYQIARAIYENLDELAGYHDALTHVTVENSARTPIPLHPGSERYFREAGVLQ